MKDKNETYSLRADVSLDCKRIIKNVRARLTLNGKPDSIVDALELIITDYEQRLIIKN